MARFLLSAMPFTGHINPIRAVAAALVARGHDVRVTAHFTRDELAIVEQFLGRATVLQQKHVKRLQDRPSIRAT